MKKVSHKKSFSTKDLLPFKHSKLPAPQIDPFKSFESSKNHSIMLRPICHKRQLSNKEFLNSPRNTSIKVPILKLPQNLNKNMQPLSTILKNPCFSDRFPNSQFVLPEFQTPKILMSKPFIEPLNSCRNHTISLSNLNKKMQGQMNKLIKKREKKYSSETFDFSFGN